MGRTNEDKNLASHWKAALALRKNDTSLQAIDYELNRIITQLKVSLASDIDIKLLNQLIALSIQQAYARDLIERLKPKQDLADPVD